MDRDTIKQMLREVLAEERGGGSRPGLVLPESGPSPEQAVAAHRDRYPERRRQERVKATPHLVSAATEALHWIEEVAEEDQELAKTCRGVCQRLKAALEGNVEAKGETEKPAAVREHVDKLAALFRSAEVPASVALDEEVMAWVKAVNAEITYLEAAL